MTKRDLVKVDKKEEEAVFEAVFEAVLPEVTEVTENGVCSEVLDNSSALVMDRDALAKVLSQPLLTGSMTRKISILNSMIKSGSVSNGPYVPWSSRPHSTTSPPVSNAASGSYVIGNGGGMVFSGTLRNTPQIQHRPGPSVPEGEVLWRGKESKRLGELQVKYEKLLGDKQVPFYEGLKGGELFRAMRAVSYRVYDGVLGEVEKRTMTTSTSVYKSGVNWFWETIEPGSILMFVLRERDEDGEITPRWIITSRLTGESRIRNLYIASHKLESLVMETEK